MTHWPIKRKAHVVINIAKAEAALREEFSNSTPAFREECFATVSPFREEILTALGKGRACYGTAHGVDEVHEGSIWEGCLDTGADRLYRPPEDGDETKPQRQLHVDQAEASTIGALFEDIDCALHGAK